jgi:hypothetical protein
VREPFDSEPFGFELKVERLKAEGLMGCLVRAGLCASGEKSPVCLSCSGLLHSIAKSIFLVHCEVRTMNLYQKRIGMNPVNGYYH